MSQESSKTFGDQARLLRAIEHAITYDRQAAPRSVDMQPKYGSAIIQFAGDDMAAVKEWAARSGATVVHGTTTYDRSTGPAWHEFGTRPGGARGQLVGWSVDLWCVVNEPAPEPVVLDDAQPVDAPTTHVDEQTEAHVVDCPTCSAPEWPADDRPCCDFAEVTGGDTHATECPNSIAKRGRV